MSLPIKVFISYAWESEDFRKEVATLAHWLQTNGDGKITVVTDHLYTHRAPNVGWPTWMANQIEDSDVVLIICTKAYHDRFRKKEAKGKGRGAIYEGAIITQELVNAQTINDKFFPILPDGGDLENIPLILQQYFNGQFFSSGNDSILKMVLNDNPTYDQSIRQFFEAESVETSVKESLADDIQNQINAEIIKEIVGQFKLPKVKKELNMLSPLQNTVRAFLGLNDFDKLKIVKDIGIDLANLNHDNIVERDKQIFKIVNDKKLIAPLWNALNELKAFGNPTNNPFTK
jgi:hypothetical protein